MKQHLFILTCSIALATTGSLYAQTPVKSVDSAGNVTYSDKPTADAASSSEVPIDASPTESQIEAAKQRADKTRTEADKAQAERKALSSKRESERKEAAREKSAQTPQPIEESSGYPVYDKPLKPRPPIAKPPGNGGDHPAYTPPGARPPVARPMPSPR